MVLELTSKRGWARLEIWRMSDEPSVFVKNSLHGGNKRQLLQIRRRRFGGYERDFERARPGSRRCAQASFKPLLDYCVLRVKPCDHWSLDWWKKRFGRG